MSESYQSILAGRSRFPLIDGPSPLHRAYRLEDNLRTKVNGAVPRLYLKRDDLLSLAMGGNKIRNLEYLIGEALARGATDVVTAGRIQSNHCRLTAAACVRAGLRTHAVLSGTEPSRYQGNLLLDRLLGARLHFTGTEDREVREATVQNVVEGIVKDGGVPYVIPVGGSDPLGALGHVAAAGELAAQLAEIGVSRATVVHATATGGTQAGMLAGFVALRAEFAVVGFAVAKSAEELQGDVARIAVALLAAAGATVPATSSVIVSGDALGAGYGAPTAPGADAISLLARTEGVLVDPIYAGKALAGLIGWVRAGRFGPDETVVFIHTGGVPALFATTE